MKNNIKLIKCRDIIDVRDGTHNTPKYVSNGFPLVTSKNLINGKIDFSSIQYISEEDHISISKRSLVEEGDILYSMIGSIGNMALIDFEREFSIKNVALFKFKNSPLFNKYFYYLLQSDYVKKQIIKNSKGGTQKFVSLNVLRDIKIPVFPLKTQKKIAEILDIADSLRQKDKALIKKCEQLTQSLFLEMFGELEGEEQALSSVCIINPKKSEINNLDKSLNVSFIPMANVSEKGKLKQLESRRLEEVWNGFTYCRDGDVIFAKITPCMENGKGAIMKNLSNRIGFGSTEFHVLRPVSNLTTSAWIYYLTSMPYFRKEAEGNMTGSAGQRRVPTDFLKNFKVKIPPIEIQNKFTIMVEGIEYQKQLVEQNLQKSEALFNSLLQKAFKGELITDEQESILNKETSLMT